MGKYITLSRFHKNFSNRIRFVKARGWCECRGECGRDHEVESAGKSKRCLAVSGRRHLVTGHKVKLKAVHMDHNKRNGKNENMRAMCFHCWRKYAGRHDLAVKSARRQAKFTKFIGR